MLYNLKSLDDLLVIEIVGERVSEDVVVPVGQVLVPDMLTVPPLSITPQNLKSVQSTTELMRCNVTHILAWRATSLFNYSDLHAGLIDSYFS